MEVQDLGQLRDYGWPEKFGGWRLSVGPATPGRATGQGGGLWEESGILGLTEEVPGNRGRDGAAWECGGAGGCSAGPQMGLEWETTPCLVPGAGPCPWTPACSAGALRVCACVSGTRRLVRASCAAPESSFCACGVFQILQERGSRM